jgi:hypothetical protein
VRNDAPPGWFAVVLPQGTNLRHGSRLGDESSLRS